MLIINKHQKTTLSQQGFTLVEFMISMALSLAAILVVTSIYITSFQIDSKTIKFSRLNDEVTSIMALLSEDIKRAGYVANSENSTKKWPDGNTSACDPNPVNCAPEQFRTVLVDKFTDELVDNSCILFSYDFNDNGAHDPSDEDFGYRLNSGELETRQDGIICTAGGWQTLTDKKFVTISNLIFKCKVSDDGDDDADGDGDTDDYETITDADGNATNIEIDCAAGNLPYQSHIPADKDGKKGHITVEISFTATLVDDDTISITASEKILVRNKSYD